MLRLRRIWSHWPTAGLLLAALIFLYVIARSSSFQSCYTHNEQYARYQQEQESFYLLSWLFRNAKVSVRCAGDFTEQNHGPLTAAATILLAFFTTTLWWATRKLVKHATEIERAYVSGGATIEVDVVGQELVGVEWRPLYRPRNLIITVDNYGKTPAYVSHIAYSICAAEELPDPANLARDYQRSKMLVNFNVGPGTAGMRTNLRREFSQAVGKIVYGRFYYTDIFGDHHSSGFILEVTPNGNTVAFDAPPEFTTRD